MVYPHRPIRLLLVEDNLPLRAAVEHSMKKHGHDVTVAGSIAEACAKIEQTDSAFNFLVSDIELPDGRGERVLERVRSDHYVPSIAITGAVLSSDFQQLIDAGFNMVIEKPFRFESLHDAIQTFAPMFGKAS